MKLIVYCPRGSYSVQMSDTSTKIKFHCPVVSYIVLMTMYIMIKVKLHCPRDKG